MNEDIKVMSASRLAYENAIWHGDRKTKSTEPSIVQSEDAALYFKGRSTNRHHFDWTEGKSQFVWPKTEVTLHWCSLPKHNTCEIELVLDERGALVNIIGIESNHSLCWHYDTATIIAEWLIDFTMECANEGTCSMRYHH